MPEKINGAIQNQLSHSGNPLKKYQYSVIGRSSIKDLILYEMFTLFCIPASGKAGVMLRRLGLPIVSAHIGKSVTIGRDNFILQPHKLYLGNNVTVGDKVTFGIKPDGERIVLSDNVSVGDRTIFNCTGAVVMIGKGTRIANDCRLGSLKELTVGSFCNIGQFTCISGASHTYSGLDKPIIQQSIISKGPTIIEDNVRIGEHVTILEGVHIGENSTIADYSLVNKDVPPHSLVAGTPAQVCG